MKLSKTVDEKLAEIGFVKEEEDKYGCVYKRKDKEYNFTQKVFIGHKKSGGHIQEMIKGLEILVLVLQDMK